MNPTFPSVAAQRASRFYARRAAGRHRHHRRARRAAPARRASRPRGGRRTQCKNNLRQLGLAVQTYHDARGAFPSGRDDGGQARRLLGVQLACPIWSRTRSTGVPQGRRSRSRRQCHGHAHARCRRSSARARAPIADRDFDNDDEPTLKPGVAAGGDYAANVGDEMDNDGRDTFDPENAGPIYTRSKINARQVTDGLSHTFVIGEKFITEEIEPGEEIPSRDRARRARRLGDLRRRFARDDPPHRRRGLPRRRARR